MKHTLFCLLSGLLYCFLYLGLSIGQMAHAEERIDMEGTTIIGNRELPKVLYIVPWKSSELPDLGQLPLSTLIDEALAPIDREVFLRQVRYYHILTPGIDHGNEN